MVGRNGPLQLELERSTVGTADLSERILKTEAYPYKLRTPDAPAPHSGSRWAELISWQSPARPVAQVFDYPSSEAYRGFYMWAERHDLLHKNYYSQMYWPVSPRVVPAPSITSNRDALAWVYKLPGDPKIDVLRQPRPLEPWGLYEYQYIHLQNNCMWGWDVQFPYPDRYKGRYKRKLQVTHEPDYYFHKPT